MFQGAPHWRNLILGNSLFWEAPQLEEPSFPIRNSPWHLCSQGSPQQEESHLLFIHLQNHSDNCVVEPCTDPTTPSLSGTLHL